MTAADLTLPQELRYWAADSTHWGCALQEMATEAADRIERLEAALGEAAERVRTLPAAPDWQGPNWADHGEEEWLSAVDALRALGADWAAVAERGE